MNNTYTKDLNSTYSKETQSYDITPARHELPPEPLKDEENYDIGDIKSDDDTDDEDNPRKVIPKWACGMILTVISIKLNFNPILAIISGSAFRAALMHQAYNPPDVDMIFKVMEATPNLEEIFAHKKRRFFKRTSSAVWGKAPVSHKW